MKRKLLVVFVSVLSIFTLATSHAQATLIFNIERTSDTTANVTASGILDGPSPLNDGHIISFYYPFPIGSGPTGFSNQSILSSSTMQVGSTSIDFSYILGPDFSEAGGSPWIYFGNSSFINFSVGDSVTGTLALTLPAGLTFALVGYSGTARSGLGINGEWTGSWNMVSSDPIPEPATMLLLGTGLVGVAGAARRKKKNQA